MSEKLDRDMMLSGNERRRGRREHTGETETKKGGIGRFFRIFFLVLLILAVLAAAGIYIAGMVYYKDKFFRNTTINGIDVSDRTVDDVENQIAHQIGAYQITVSERGDITETITATQIGYHYVSKGEVQAFQKSQKLYEWPLHLKKPVSYTFESSAQYDNEKLEAVLDAMACFQEENIVRPQDAYIDLVDGSYMVLAEIEGNLLKKDDVKRLIREAIDFTNTSINLEEKNCYEIPAKRQNDEGMAKTVSRLNTCISTDLTYLFGAESVKVDAEVIRPWLTYDELGNVFLDADAVTGFVNDMADRFDSADRPREFRTQTGTTVTVEGGEYGWLMDRETTRDYLVDAIWGGNTGETYAIFLQTAMSWYNSDLGDDYVEVDLGGQHVWLHIGGEVVVSTDCVSGLASDPARRTPSGTYTLYYKESPSVLKGENNEYETKVTYWMPFNGGIGLHDASWRSAFGGGIYQSDGSHGCINLPSAKAKEIYEYVYDGIPVICYY